MLELLDRPRGIPLLRGPADQFGREQVAQPHVARQVGDPSDRVLADLRAFDRPRYPGSPPADRELADPSVGPAHRDASERGEDRAQAGVAELVDGAAVGEHGGTVSRGRPACQRLLSRADRGLDGLAYQLLELDALEVGSALPAQAVGFGERQDEGCVGHAGGIGRGAERLRIAL